MAEATIRRHQELIDVLRQGLSCRNVLPDYTYDDADRVNMCIWQQVNKAWFLTDAAWHRHRQGRDREAIELLVIPLAVAADMMHGDAPLVAELQRMICNSIVLGAVRQLLAEHALGVADLKWFSQQIDGIVARKPTVGYVMRGESIRAERACIGVAWDVAAWEQFVQRPQLMYHRSREIPMRYVRSRSITAASALGLLDHFVRVASEIDNLPVSQRNAAAFAAIADLCSSDNPLIDMFPREDQLRATWVNRTLDDLNVALARLAIAVAWYEADKGCYPASLDALAPQYLAQLPQDPLTGSAFSLVLSDGGAKVYSSGLDGEGSHPKPCGGFEDGDIEWIVKRL